MEMLVGISSSDVQTCMLLANHSTIKMWPLSK